MQIQQPELQTELVSPKGEATRQFIIETLQTILLAIVLYFLIDTFIARVRVEKVSMYPTLQPGQFILVNKFAYRIGEMEHGDILIFHFPDNPEEDYIKRLIGLPGDYVEIHHGLVFINGEQLVEPYQGSPPNDIGDWTVPQDSIFVLGDNRRESSDSRAWGFVPTQNIVGKAIFRYWPFDEIKILSQSKISAVAK